MNEMKRILGKAFGRNAKYPVVLFLTPDSKALFGNRPNRKSKTILFCCATLLLFKMPHYCVMKFDNVYKS